ncbi:MAG: NERD domain-containing protein [Nitrosomonadales bacterium]
MSLMSIFKGFLGEAIGSLAHKALLDSTVYHELNNVTIPTSDGTTQIDHIIVSRYGIFVIEAKTMKGWIFGNENSAEWTQSFPGGKFKFQNPLRQNYRHTKCLSDFLGIDHAKFHSVVMFWGESTFKTNMPKNVLGSGYTSYIKGKSELLFSDSDVEQIVIAIRSGRLPKTWATHVQHVSSLNARHSKATESVGKSQLADQKCPKCGSAMLKRLAKNGVNSGNMFWGCSRYPGCRGIVNIMADL